MSIILKKRLVYVGISITVIIGIFVIMSIINSFQKVTLTYNTSNVSKLEAFPATNTRNTLEINGDAVQAGESGKEMTLKKGLYALKPMGEKIPSDLIELRVGEKPVQMTIDPDYTSTYLKETLQNEEQSILQAINTSNILLPSIYRINPGSLYHHGEWFGTTLTYIGTDSLSRDTLRLVVKKEGEAWKVVTTPPNILLSAKKYPEIPFAVLKAVNGIDLSSPVIPSTTPIQNNGHSD